MEKSNKENKKMDELLHAKEKAEEMSRIKSEFLARVTHDLRTPLNGIIGFAELMYHDKVGHLSTEQKEYLADILTSARHMQVLINDVLDIAKVEAGKMEFQPELVDLHKTMNETRHVFESLSSKKNIDLKVEIDPTLKFIKTDPARLKQIIYNYVSNALKCTPENGHVIIRFIPEKDHFFKIEVIDTGIGIRKEDMHKLFIEFQQLDRTIAKKYPSSGLGLALTKHIVDALGGRVGAESTYGKGSTFYAILPLTKG